MKGDNKMSANLRKMLDEVIDVGNLMHKNGIGARQLTKDMTTGVMLLGNMSSFILYMLASTNKVTDEQAKFFKTCFNMELTPDDTVELMKDLKMNKVDYELPVIPSMILFVLADNKLKGRKVEDVNFSDMLYDVMVALGNGFLECDGATEMMRSRMESYLDKLRKYIDRTLK